jgi:hypothetical protein
VGNPWQVFFGIRQLELEKEGTGKTGDASSSSS